MYFLLVFIIAPYLTIGQNEIDSLESSLNFLKPEIPKNKDAVGFFLNVINNLAPYMSTLCCATTKSPAQGLHAYASWKPQNNPRDKYCRDQCHSSRSPLRNRLWTPKAP